MAAPASSLAGDCLLDVFLRLDDPVSIVRCAAVSKHWRPAVIDNVAEIRRHLRRQADRHLFFGFHYRHRERLPAELDFSRRSSWSSAAASAGRRHWWNDLLPVPCNVPELQGIKTNLYTPLACSDGLLLICLGFLHEIFVCYPLTGFHVSMRTGEFITHRYVLHSCHVVDSKPSPNSFQMIAMDTNKHGILELQNYSSQTNAWGSVLRPKADKVRMPYEQFFAAPVVCRGAIHWLCTNASDYPSGGRGYTYFSEITHTVAVDMSTGRARMSRLPTRCAMSEDRVDVKKKMLLLATSGDDDRLSLVRRDEEAGLEVTIWLYTPDVWDWAGDDDDDGSNWVPWRTIDIQKLVEDAGLAHYLMPGKDWAMLETKLDWCCPKSHHVILRIPYLGLFVLDLDNTQIQRAAAADNDLRIWPFEANLTIYFSSMRPFF